MGEVINFPGKPGPYEAVEKWVLETLGADTGLTEEQAREVAAEFKPHYDRMMEVTEIPIEMPVSAMPHFVQAQELYMERLAYASCIIVGLLARAKLHKT